MLICILDLDLTDLHAKSIAEELTDIESKLFQAINFREFLGQAWSKKGSEWKSPNILAMIRRYFFEDVNDVLFE